MPTDEREMMKRLLADSLAQAMAEAQHQLEDAEVAEVVTLAELATHGYQMVRWSPPGPFLPVCNHCSRTGEWYQSVVTGTVRCRCELLD